MSTKFLVIPPTLNRLIVPQSIVLGSAALLAEPGVEGFEAAVLWLGTIVSAHEARVTAPYFPRQYTYRSADGLAVEIPVAEWTALALRLPPGLFVLAKLHTHGTSAYHSHVDAANPYLSHEGAVAITVPDFARNPLADFTGCSVNIMRNHRWVELTAHEVRQLLTVVEDGTDG